MSQVGQELVCNGALCRCDKGTLPSMLQGKEVATTLDKTFLPFGTCMMKNNLPCVPMLLMWQDAFELVAVQTPMSHPLLEKSTIKCAIGGTVSILSTLQIAVPGLPSPSRTEAARLAFMNLCPLLINESA